MKFDVVIGNPPYQSDKRGLKLWPMFIERSLGLADIVALVTPTGIMKTTTSKQGHYLKQLCGHGLKLITTTADKYFTVGIPICYWICDKSHTGGFEVDSVQYDNNAIHVPRDTTELFVSIMDKVKSQDIKLDVKRDPKDKSGPHVSFKRLNHLGSKINATINSPDNDLYIFSEDAERLCELLNSKLFNFVNTRDRHDPVIYHQYMSTYTYPSTLNADSDETIYQSYRLSDQEIAYIESH